MLAKSGREITHQSPVHVGGKTPIFGVGILTRGQALSLVEIPTYRVRLSHPIWTFMIDCYIFSIAMSFLYYQHDIFIFSVLQFRPSDEIPLSYMDTHDKLF